MAVARLVMQNWKDKYNQILKASKIEEILSGLYVDDSRAMHRKLRYRERYCPTENRFSHTIASIRIFKLGKELL